MSSPGRPTFYAPEFCDQAHNYCLLGATNEDLAGFFHVCRSTIDNWLASHPDFAAAVTTGRAEADARVARCLYGRAVGYEQRTEREVIVKGELRTLAQTVQHPPNVQACIFWLRNRRPRDWSRPPNPASDSAAGPGTAEDWAAFEAANERARELANQRTSTTKD